MDSAMLFHSLIRKYFFRMKLGVSKLQQLRKQINKIKIDI